MDAFPQPSAAAPTPGGFGAFGPGGETPKRAHLYIGNLSPKVTEYMLQEIFAVAGPVMGVKIIPDRNFQHGGLNYGFVEYHELRSAEVALATLNGRTIFDCEIRCNWANQNQANKEDLTNHCHLFVGDLSPEVTDDILTKAFAAFGSLSDARIMWDMNSGKSRGYGFLAFRDKTDAEQAVAAMNGEWLGSRAIRVNWANQKNQGMEGGVPGSMQGGGVPASMSGGGGGGGPPAQAYGGGGGGTYESIVAQCGPTATTIYVGNLPPFVTQQDLIPLFQGYGYIVEIRMQADRGFAFVKMDTHENAAMAIVSLQGTNVQGRTMKCSWGKDRNDGPVGATSAPPQQQLQQQQYQQYAPQPQAQQQAPQDPAALLAAQQWQAQYGAQWAAYVQQQQMMQQQAQGGAPPGR